MKNTIFLELKYIYTLECLNKEYSYAMNYALFSIYFLLSYLCKDSNTTYKYKLMAKAWVPILL